MRRFSLCWDWFLWERYDMNAFSLSTAWRYNNLKMTKLVQVQIIDHRSSSSSSFIAAQTTAARRCTRSIRMQRSKKIGKNGRTSYTVVIIFSSTVWWAGLGYLARLLQQASEQSRKSQATWRLATGNRKAQARDESGRCTYSCNATPVISWAACWVGSIMLSNSLQHQIKKFHHIL